TSSIVAQLEETPNELPPIAQLESVFGNAGIDRKHRVVLYSDDPILAARAWFTLDYLGRGQTTSILDGGKAKWVSERRALSTDPVIAKPSAFEAIPHEETITRFRAVRDAVRLRDLVEPYLVLIDAREPSQFCGDEAGADVRRPGRIPGAVNLPWSLNLTTTATPVLRPAAELRAIYEQSGVGKATRNIVYCRTGMQASVDYFVLKYLGYDASLYDGSFIEWSRSAELIE
ncbi:MAG: sulfurtransferase, partial [Thermoanaerobaculia bacterium]